MKYVRRSLACLTVAVILAVSAHSVLAALPLIGSFPSGSVARWKLTEASGDRADSVGSSTLTDVNTVASTTGQFSENAADFEADNDERFTSADSATLSITGDMSICLWMKAESALSDSEKVLISKSLSTGDQRGFYLAYTDYVGAMYEISAGTKGVVLQITDSGASNGVQKGVNFAWVVGTWNHLCVVYIASAGSVEYYLNGVSQGTKTGFPASQVNNTADLQIGAVQGVLDYDGQMQDSVLWNVALSDANALAVYNSYFAAAGSTYTPQFLLFE